MASFKKDDRVLISDQNQAGVIFWVGKSKFGPGMRYGVRGDDGETYWTDDKGLQAEGAPAETRSDQKPTVDSSRILRAVRKHAKNFDEAAALREVENLPADKRAAFLWKHVGPGKIAAVNDLLAATAQSIAEIPLKTALAALETRSANSEGQCLPGVGENTLRLLRLADLSDGAYLHSHLAELPPHLQQAFWLARGQNRSLDKGLPETTRDEILNLLPEHALSGRMGGLELGQILEWLGIELDEIREPWLKAIRASTGPLSFNTLACLLVGLDVEVFCNIAPRLNLRHLSDKVLSWWLEHRAELLPQESLADTVRVLAAIAARVADENLESTARRQPAEACEAGARCLAERCRQRAEPICDSLLDFFSSFTENLESWQPIFEAIDERQRKAAAQKLRGLLEPHRRPRLFRLELLAFGPDVVTELIEETERALDQQHSVGVRHLIEPLGRLGDVVIEPLRRRIAELTESLDPHAKAYAEGYRPRRKIIALRNALIIALDEVATQGRLIEEALDEALWPKPTTLFAGNDDFSFCFFDGLQGAKALFSELAEDRLRFWIQAWRDSGLSDHLEDRLKRVMPARRRKLLADAPSLAQQIEQLAQKTGLACTEPIYLLERRKKRSQGLSYNRVGFRPKGPPEAKAPRGYQPVLSLDLQSAPELQPLFPGARAICLYVDKPRQGFDAAAIIRLSEEECPRGISGGKNFEAQRLMVPPEVFCEENPCGDLDILRRRIREAPGRALGRPFFLQQKASPGDEIGFVLEAGERFCGLNLGDSGQLYMFADDAFWECR